MRLMLNKTVILFSCLVIGCWGNLRSNNINPPPDWVNAYNEGKNIDGFGESIVGVGYSEPAFFVSKTIEIAMRSARAEVARSFKGTIKNVIFEKINLESTVQENLTTYKTNVILENSRIMDIWVDVNGTLNTINGAYALCVVPRNLTSVNLGAGDESQKLLEKGVPGWLVSPSMEPGVIKSIGYSEKAYYTTDQHSYAFKNAVKEIQKIIELRISEIIVSYEGLDTGWIRSASEEELTSNLAEVIISNSVEMDYWVDEEGLLNCKGCSYLLLEVNPQKGKSVNVSFKEGFKVDKSEEKILNDIIRSTFTLVNE